MDSNETMIVPTMSVAVANVQPVSLLEIRQRPDLYPRLYTTPYDRAVEMMRKVVLLAYTYKGQKATKGDLDFLASQLYLELISDNEYDTKYLSWEEVALAVRQGALGIGGEMFGVNISSLFGAVVRYILREGATLAARAHKLIK